MQWQVRIWKVTVQIQILVYKYFSHSKAQSNIGLLNQEADSMLQTIQALKYLSFAL